MNKWFRKRMILLIITLFVIYLVFRIFTNQNFGINKTVGWAWDVSNYYYWTGLLTWCLSFLGYGLLFLFRVQTDLVLSRLHLVILTILLILSQMHGSSPTVLVLFEILSLLVLAVNIIKSIRRRVIQPD